MKFEVTRSVVSDLWPLCQSGDASADTRALVDAYLREDAPFAEKLRASEHLQGLLPQIRLSPDAERRLLEDAAKRARIKMLLIGGALGVGALLLIGSFVALLLLMGNF
jgi:ferric-dicitrate binding protein FerR (iron transport regulator)